MNCSNACPLDELGELRDELEQVHGIDPCETSLEELAEINLPKVDGLIRLFVHHLNLWEMECDQCKSFPKEKAVMIRKYCQFIGQVMEIMGMLKPQKKEENSDASLYQGISAA